MLEIVVYIKMVGISRGYDSNLREELQERAVKFIGFCNKIFTFIKKKI
ncbi:hypothetical protein SDC9_168500 [bioreactor metagenome]|uniref:Uncharacterized protein n=1 Tax=bioreactor metagenome TaxID=1076179 RepID=A0A645G2Q4_9ZZZZ